MARGDVARSRGILARVNSELADFSKQELAGKSLEAAVSFPFPLLVMGSLTLSKHQLVACASSGPCAL